MVNDRFPHTVKVSRITENPDYNPSFGNDEEQIETVIFESVCQNQLDTNGDTTNREGAKLSDYTIYAPYPDYSDDNPLGDRSKSPHIKRDDDLELNDGVRVIKGRVVQFEAGNLGIRIWWNETR